MQSAYKIDDHKDKSAGMGLKKGPAGDELIIMDDDVSGLASVNRASKPAQRKSILPPINGAKTGGWGKGEMAAAGTLMVGDVDLDRLAPPGAVAKRNTAMQEEDEDDGLEMEVPVLPNRNVQVGQ